MKTIRFFILLPLLLIRYAVSPAFRREVEECNEQLAVTKAKVAAYYNSGVGHVG